MNNYYNLLNLNKLEQKVLKSISTKAKIVAVISRDLSVPRTSVDDIVRRLTKRGLIKKTKRLKRFFYKKKNELEIIQDIFPSKKIPEGKYALPLLEFMGITIYSGVDDVLAVFQSMMENYTTGRVYGIQSNSSVLSIFKNIPHKKINEINNLINKNNVIQEAILEEGYFEEIKKIPNLNYLKWLKILCGRTTIVHEISKDYMNFEGELVIYKQSAILTDWKNLIAIEILHPEMVKLLKALFFSFQRIGTRIDLKKM